MGRARKRERAKDTTNDRRRELARQAEVLAKKGGTIMGEFDYEAFTEQVRLWLPLLVERGQATTPKKLVELATAWVTLERPDGVEIDQNRLASALDEALEGWPPAKVWHEPDEDDRVRHHDG